MTDRFSFARPLFSQPHPISRERTRDQIRTTRQEARRRFFAPRLEQLEGRALLASVPVMLGDLNPGVAASVGHSTDAEHGLELWRTDGTSVGAQTVTDLAAGEGEASPELQASNLRLEWFEEVSWGSVIDIQFEVASATDIDEFEFQVYASGDATFDGAALGDYIVEDVFASSTVVGAGETQIIYASVYLPPVPPPGFDLTGDLYLGLILDPHNGIEETNEANNVNQGEGIDVILVREQPEVLHVLTHGVDQYFGEDDSFERAWSWYFPDDLFMIASETELAGKSGTYSATWNSTAGWTRALTDLVALAWLDTPGAVPLPPETIAELKLYAEADLQFAMERAQREVEAAAQRIVHELTARGDLINPADQQKIHLVGQGSGAVVNARVAQLLNERGFAITQFTSIDGLATDWPGIGLDLGMASLAGVNAARKVNYRVEAPLDQPIFYGELTTGVGYLVGSALEKMLGVEVDMELVPNVLDNPAAPARSPQFVDVLIPGMFEDEESKHFSAAELYFTTFAAEDLAWLENAPLPTPLTPTASTVSPLVQNILDGSFEWSNTLVAMLGELDPFDSADEFTRTWLEAVSSPASIVATNWDTEGLVEVVAHAGGGGLKLGQTEDATRSVARHDLFVPANAELTFDLHAIGSPDELDYLTIDVYDFGGVTTLYSIPLYENEAQGSHTVSLAGFAGQFKTIVISYEGELGTGDAIVLDNLEIHTGGHSGNMVAEIPAGQPGYLALTVTDIAPLPGGIDAVRYYVETNDQPGLQIDSDRLLGQATSEGDNWRFAFPAAGLKYGSNRMYAVTWDGNAVGPDIFFVDFFWALPTTEFAYHRSSNPLDVDGDGIIAPLDALIIINAINSGMDSNLLPPDRVPFAFDTSPNNILEPLDALLVINYLNSAPAVGLLAGGANEIGEGEWAEEGDDDADESTSAVDRHYDAALLAWLDFESASRKRRQTATLPVPTDR